MFPGRIKLLAHELGDNIINLSDWWRKNLLSYLVHVMAWFRQATSQYLNQCWPRSISPHGVTRFETKWPPFLIRHFQARFLEWWTSKMYSQFIKICSQRSNYHYARIDLDNVLTMNRRQGVFLTNEVDRTDAYICVTQPQYINPMQILGICGRVCG